MIERVSLKNFRSHEDSKFDFSGGTNALVGIIGSGKSTVVNALSFGLFGTFPDLQSKKVKLDDIIMNKPNVKDKAEVTVDFTVDNKTYSVMRVIEREKGTTYSEIREGDKLLDAPNSQRVTELVEKLLKINYDLFSKAIYSEQNELDYFLTLPRGERMRKIDNLLTIDKFEQARSSVVSLKNKIVDRKMGKQSVIEQTDIGELKKTINELKQELDELRENKIKTSAEFYTLEKAKSEIEAEVKRLEQMNKDLTYYREQEKSIESAVEENKKFIEDIEKLLKGRTQEEMEKDLQELSDKIKKLDIDVQSKRSEQEKLTELISETKTKAEFLEEDKMRKIQTDISKKLSLNNILIEIKKEHGQKPFDKVDKEKKEMEKIIEKLSSLETSLLESRRILEEIHKLKDHCPICSSKLSEEKKKNLIQKQKENIEKIESEIKTLEKEKKILKESLGSLEDVIDKFKQLTNEVKDLDELQIQLKQLKILHSKQLKTLESYQKNLKRVKAGIDILLKNVEDVKDEKQILSQLQSRIPEIKNKKSRLEYLDSRMEDVKRKISEINKELKYHDLEKIRKELTEIASKESKFGERLKNINESLKEKETRKNEEEEKLETIEKQKSEIARLEKIVKDLQIFEKALVQTQSQLRTEFITAVNYTMNDIWPNLYPYGDFNSAALNIQEGDYVLQLRARDGSWINAEGVASGGERSIAALALRIAFSLVLAPNMKMIILDEPTANLDSRSISELAVTLRERINEFLDQTFLITHQRELEDAITGVGYRIERNKEEDGTSTAIKIQ